MSEPLGVGSTVYLFDSNCRAYHKDGNGKSVGVPIWIKHWHPYKIVGENRVSWLLERGERFPKKNGTITAGKGGYSGMEVATSWEAVKELEWIHVHRHAIIKIIERCKDASIMRQIAAAVGYTGESNDV